MAVPQTLSMAQIDQKIAHKVADALCEAALNMRDMNGLLVQPQITNPHVIYQVALTAIMTIAGHPVHVTGQTDDAAAMRVFERPFQSR